MFQNRKRTLGSLPAYKRRFFADLICCVLVSAFALVIPLIVRFITDTLLGNPAEGMDNILGAAGVMLLCIALQAGCNYYMDAKGHALGARRWAGRASATFRPLPAALLLFTMSTGFLPHHQRFAFDGFFTASRRTVINSGEIFWARQSSYPALTGSSRCSSSAFCPLCWPTLHFNGKMGGLCQELRK